MSSWMRRMMMRKKMGSRIRQQFVQILLLWNVRFLRNSALDCPMKGVLRLATRLCTSSCVNLTPCSSVVVDMAAVPPCFFCTLTDTLNCWPPETPSGTATWKLLPCTSTATICPAVASGGAVTRTLTVSISTSRVSSAISVPFSSVPHLTVKVTPCGEVRGSSLPRRTETASPLCSVTLVSLLLARASSTSQSCAMRRKTSSSVDI
mmetsp:Transcript_33878/g.66062  ORF Transcript_33878/g.66062 Transcript_33878/m.66062 type:complete len:206 (+) Transcript_33878:4434-5051(+)